MKTDSTAPSSKAPPDAARPVPRWISGDTLAPEKPAPALFRAFELAARPRTAVLTLAVADGLWRAFDSPVVFNALRNGEWYDARREGARPNERPAKVEKYAPWGVVSPEDAAPCREFEAFEPVRVLVNEWGENVYDFGANIAGWCEIEVEGAAALRAGPRRARHLRNPLPSHSLQKPAPSTQKVQ